MMISVESYPEVQTFLNKNDPNHEQIVKAYVIRDEVMGLNSDDVFYSAMVKLGLHPDKYQSQIDYRYRQSMIDRLDQFLKDKQDCQFFIPIDHHSFSLDLMNREYKQRLIRYNQLFEMKDNMKNVYSDLSKDELIYLGW